MAPVPEPVVVLGTAGIGKSTICLAALHAPDVEARYGPRRHFIRLDATKSVEALISEVATALKVSIGLDTIVGFGNARPGNLVSKIIDKLESANGPTVLVLDSAETPWDADEAGTEEFVAALAKTALKGRQRLGLVVAVRGRMRPVGVPWRKRIDLLPLSDEDGRDLFLQIANQYQEIIASQDQDLEPLIYALDGNPLAIDLIARASSLGTPISTLLERWQGARAQLLTKIAVNDPMLPLKVSMQVAIDCEHVTEEAKRLLAILGRLPDGIASDDLDSVLPFDGKSEVKILSKTGLALEEDSRWRLMPPVGEFARAQVPLHEKDLEKCMAYFLNLAERGKQVA